MSSPVGLQYSQADFLARWMPSSTRAGVILNPSPDVAGSSRPSSGPGSTALQPDDSFSSDFAPLPTSADSSCLDVDRCVRSAGGGTSGNDGPVDSLYPAAAGGSGGHVDSLSEMTSQTQNTALMMKLDQLRKWQQHMHEQLKAHQLEEVLCLQEEHRKLLGVMNGSQPSAGENRESSQWDEELLYHSPDVRCSEIPQRSRGLQQEMELRWSDHDDDEEHDSEEQSADMRHVAVRNMTPTQPEAAVWSEGNSKQQDDVVNERPIRPGIGGQKQTFEELLEEQLRLEEQRLKFAQFQQKQDRSEAVQVPPKRPFLKRGDGLSRFTNNRNASSQKVEAKEGLQQPRGRVMSRSSSAPAFIQKDGSNGVHQLPVQRKTATLIKGHQVTGLCSQDRRTESKAARTKVFHHQRQNTAPESTGTGPEDRQTDHQAVEQIERKVGVSFQTLRTCSPSMDQNPAAKQVGLLGGPGTTDNDAAKEKSSSPKEESAEVRTGKGGGAPPDSFEMSFQEKLQLWEQNSQLESMELGEFELLEQAAEELSFSSNSSFVTKVLQMDQQKRQVAAGLYKRRLSSTPVKSSSRAEAQECGGVQHSEGLAGGNISVESGASVAKMKSDALTNKLSSDDEDGQCRKEEGASDTSSGCGSEFGDKVVVMGTACFPAASDPPYDKRSYQEEDSFRDSDVAHEEDEESDSVPSSADDSMLIADRDSQQERVVFDDDDTWNDLEDTLVGKSVVCRKFSPVSMETAVETSPVEKTLLRKVAVNKAVELDNVLNPDPPPASQLMTRLFPSLKPKPQNAPLLAAAAPESKKPKDETGQQVQSVQLRERLAELEIEIKRFKKENAALTKLRQENEKQQEDLRKERLEFEQNKAEELAKFEEYKKEENKKLQKDRKLFEKHASAARAIPDKKEREEIQSLKQQLSSLQEELRRKESRWASTHNRLRQQIDSLHQENGSLRDEIRMLEKLRLSVLKKSSISAENDIGTKDLPRTSETNVPSVTKGVTFASPVDSRGSSSSSSPPLSRTARRSSKDISQGSAGTRSSLRKSAGSGSSLSSSSSSLSFSKTLEEEPGAACKNQETPPKQDHSEDSSLNSDPGSKQLESCEAKEPQSPQEVFTLSDDKVEKVQASGERLIVFPNGTRKEISADGLTAKITFFNGDTKQITADQRVIYYYAETQTTHVTYPDGTEVLHFNNNQTEKHFPDGRKEITFPDQTVKNLFPDGREESVLRDGTIIQVNPGGTKEIHFNTGQKEIHTPDYKRREYPDGTVKTVYSDGRQETRYPTGRLRVKDKDGNVVLDNRV